MPSAIAGLIHSSIAGGFCREGCFDFLSPFFPMLHVYWSILVFSFTGWKIVLCLGLSVVLRLLIFPWLLWDSGKSCECRWVSLILDELCDVWSCPHVFFRTAPFVPSGWCDCLMMNGSTCVFNGRYVRTHVLTVFLSPWKMSHSCHPTNAFHRTVCTVRLVDDSSYRTSRYYYYVP